MRESMKIGGGNGYDIPHLKKMMLERQGRLPLRLSMVKLKEVGKSEDLASREKYVTWTDETTKFMLEWYIEAHKDKPSTFVWKQHHHLQCADALNTKFGMGVTRNQVHRHFRSCKEKWSWIHHAMRKGGYGFDQASYKFNIDPSEKDANKLGTAKYNYLTRPIRFYNLLEELFANSSQAGGSFALDLNTINAQSDDDDTQIVKELENYTVTKEDEGGDDSDTIARNSPTSEGACSYKKRKRIKSPSKKQPKQKGKITNDDVAASIVRLADSIASSKNNAIEMVASDPHATLWRRIEELTITAKDKLEIA